MKFRENATALFLSLSLATSAPTLQARVDENINIADIKSYSDILGSINSFTKVQTNSCAAQGVNSKSIPENESECFLRLNEATEKVSACMEAYFKLDPTKKMVPAICQSVDQHDPAQMAASEAYLYAKMKGILNKIKNNPKMAYQLLSSEEKNALGALLASLKKDKSDKNLKLDLEDIRRLNNLGFEVNSPKSSELKFNPINFNPEPLKDINAPEYQILEKHLGQSAVENLKKMYVDPPLSKRGGTKAVVIGEYIITPNFGTDNNSTPIPMSQNDYDKEIESLYNRFSQTTKTCLEMSKKVNSTSHKLKTLAKNFINDPLSKKPYSDPELDEKEDCLNYVARLQYKMRVTLGLDGKISNDVLNEYKKAIEEDADNFNKKFSLADFILKLKPGIITSQDKKLKKYERSQSQKLDLKSKNQSHSCYALQIASDNIRNGKSPLISQTLEDSIAHIVPYLKEELNPMAKELKELSRELKIDNEDSLPISDDNTMNLKLKDAYNNLLETRELEKNNITKKADEAKKAEEAKNNSKKENLLDAYNDSAKRECLERIKNDISPLTNRPRNYISWNEEKKNCVDKRDEVKKNEIKKDSPLFEAYKKSLEEECLNKIKNDISPLTNKPRNYYTWDKETLTCIDKRPVAMREASQNSSAPEKNGPESPSTTALPVAKKEEVKINEPVLTIDDTDANKQKAPIVAHPEQKSEVQPQKPNTGVDPTTKPTTTPPVAAEGKGGEEKPSDSDKKEDENEKDKKTIDYSEKKFACVKLNKNDKKDEKVKTKHVWNDSNKSCEEQDLTPKEKCEKLNLETRDDVGRVLNKYKWDESKKGCIEKKKNEDGSYSDDNEKEDPRQMIDNTPKAPPARFTPVQIPMRQIYMLPGMP